MAIPVFADVDTGIDDVWALLTLLSHPEADLVAVACTAGNVHVDQVCANTLAVLELAGRADIPVSQGRQAPLRLAPGERFDIADDTHGGCGLGYAAVDEAQAWTTPYDAAEAWARAARSKPGELVGLVTGPLTNLALALRAEPELPRLLRRLVVMGGSFDYPGNTTPVAEWNISVDPEAAKEVFDAWSDAVEHTPGPPIALPLICGLNLTERIILTPELLGKLGELVEGAPRPALSQNDPRGKRSNAHNPLLRLLEDATRFYFEFHHDQGDGYIAHMHDPFAAEAAIDPEIVLSAPAAVDVELLGLITRGMTVADWSGKWRREPNAAIAVATDTGGFFDRVIPRLAAFLRQRG
ncbi:Inosine/uridine-preferring nucleoside hydrolase [Segniliparus rotundus DSM 44985]|uniref:Inosine/uridine-preferring nucleoside hydrolase n=1 Tax=Segniliparus rotundus (strain ATCC BAA-972 / CDC 1076 / CIP 108378 / DSM 44985 / JCM 13578) TaxID=640132 RepID=D6ZBS5_SEGRD|nr:nucleoside hydrolase [Segniliparus rotundus]ADG96902.1 Inosine/uridine-preferring nucleoside hydrolase [Segniliparus rotundus DSM 44985]